MSEFKVFYSWQSDLPNGTNRTFIQKSLQLACEEVAQNPEIEESPRVDQDTQGLPGAPEIPQAIMDKIDACQCFVADVSICYKGPKDKVAPNPNVLVELGYAVARLSWERIILVINTHFGSIEQLPFDLDKRRAFGYTAPEGDEDKSGLRKELASRLAAGISTIALRQPIVTRVTPTEAARDAVTSQSPDRIMRVREFYRWLLESLDTADPGVIEPQAFVDSLESSRPLAEAFSTVAEAAAIADDPGAAKELWRGFERVLERYDLPLRFQGQFDERQHDWWRFHGDEMCVILIAHLLKERKVSLIGELLGEGFVQRRWAESRNDAQADYRDLSDYVRIFQEWNALLKKGGQGGWISPHGDVLNRRYSVPSHTLPDWAQYCEADYLLALHGRSERLRKSYSHWTNWSHIYLAATPRFILEARRAEYAHQLQVLFGASGFPQLIEWIKEGWGNLNSRWKEHHRRREVPVEQIDAIGTG